MSLFSKKERLTAAAFDRSFSLGKRAHSPYFQIIHHPHDIFQGAVVVGKKVSKKAVTRNRLRRQLYAVLYHYQKKHHLNEVVIVIAKPQLTSLSSNDRKRVLETFLETVFSE